MKNNDNNNRNKNQNNQKNPKRKKKRYILNRGRKGVEKKPEGITSYGEHIQRTFG